MTKVQNLLPSCTPVFSLFFSISAPRVRSGFSSRKSSFTPSDLSCNLCCVNWTIQFYAFRHQRILCFNRQGFYTFTGAQGLPIFYGSICVWNGHVFVLSQRFTVEDQVLHRVTAKEGGAEKVVSPQVKILILMKSPELHSRERWLRQFLDNRQNKLPTNCEIEQTPRRFLQVMFV